MRTAPIFQGALLKRAALIPLALALIASSARADTAMVDIILRGPSPLSWLALLPIVYVEACVYRAILGSSPREALVFSAWANLLSTSLGFPLYPIISKPFEVFGILMIPAWNLLITGFAVSCVSEAFVIRRRLFPAGSLARALCAILLANCASYALLAVVFFTDFVSKVLEIESSQDQLPPGQRYL